MSQESEARRLGRREFLTGTAAAGVGLLLADRAAYAFDQDRPVVASHIQGAANTRRKGLRGECSFASGHRPAVSSGAQAKFVHDFAAAWTKVMNLDRYDLA